MNLILDDRISTKTIETWRMITFVNQSEHLIDTNISHSSSKDESFPMYH